MPPEHGFILAKYRPDPFRLRTSCEPTKVFWKNQKGLENIKTWSQGALYAVFLHSSPHRIRKREREQQIATEKLVNIFKQFLQSLLNLFIFQFLTVYPYLSLASPTGGLRGPTRGFDPGAPRTLSEAGPSAKIIGKCENVDKIRKRFSKMVRKLKNLENSKVSHFWFFHIVKFVIICS